MPKEEEAPTTEPEPKDPPAPEADEFTATDKAAMQAELRKKNSEAKNLRDRLTAAEAQLKEIADKDKSDSDKATDRANALEAQVKELTRENVALAAGLSTAQAKRLVGETREELEADAAELVETLGITKPEADPIPGKPKETLPRGGGDPDQEVQETDPAKLADAIPRSGW